MPDRIAKIIAHSGLCSRRDAEKLIDERRVSVNGEVINTPATLVSASDVIEVDGKKIAKKSAAELWAFYKPNGCLTAEKDPLNRTTIYDILPKNLPRLMPIGRLDYNTEGLLLLTNDGGLKREFELPSNGFKRTYRVRVYGEIDKQEIADLKNGINFEGINYTIIDAQIDSAKSEGKNHWLKITIAEGKNREIRFICEAIGLTVNRLIRVSYGEYSLGNMKQSEVRKMELKT